MTDTVLLIDGDQYLHRCCAATERDIKWDDENHVLASNEVEAWDTLSGALRDLTDHFNTKEAVVCLSEYDTPGFRLSVDPTYKAHRVTRKPLCYWDIRDKMKETYKCVSFPGLEADDVMGILATKPGRTDRIIISRDKDMKTIPGTLWTGREFKKITREEADYFHLYQTLIGDASDGYKGCPGVGPVKAEKLLKAEHDDTPWHMVVGAFLAAGLTEADALRQARLARILRWEDWDSRKKEVRLWEPRG